MLSKTTFLAIALALATFPSSSFADQPSAPAPVKRVLTKIDATGITGLFLVQVKDTLVLRNLQGQTAKSFLAEAATLKITPTVKVDYKMVKNVRAYQQATQTWLLTDETGEGVKIENDTLKTLIIVSEIDQPTTIIASGKKIVVPGHTFMFINNPAPKETLDLGGNWTAYYGDYSEKLPAIVQPTLVEISPNNEGIHNGLPVLEVGSIFGKDLSLRGQL
jgi:hypothetical protein